ncbi:ORF-108 [Teiidae poxvirus 1]|nr:ORF-108 [Teiidae poxvirus 1]
MLEYILLIADMVLTLNSKFLNNAINFSFSSPSNILLYNDFILAEDLRNQNINISYLVCCIAHITDSQDKSLFIHPIFRSNIGKMVSKDSKSESGSLSPTS